MRAEGRGVRRLRPKPPVRGGCGASLLALALLPSLCGAQGVRHVEPSERVARAGGHLPWKHRLAEALVEARKTGRHVLWYVPTVPGSPMDRTRILDLYMRAGFFSEPSLEPLLRSFVLFRGVPGRKEARTYGLRPFRFIEPGFLVLDPVGRERLRLHALTTYCPSWLRERLSGFAGPRPRKRPRPGAEGMRNLLEAGKPLEALRFFERKKPEEPEARFLAGAANWSLGRHERADRIWKRLAGDLPGDPSGIRAAAELERFGPIARGFWTWSHRDRRGNAAVRTTALPIRGTELPALRDSGIRFLLSMQDEDGGWRDSNYDFGGLDSVPNVQVAVSAICLQALADAWEDRKASSPPAGPVKAGKSREKKKGRVSPPSPFDPAVLSSALSRGLRFVFDPKNRNDDDRDEWIWARVYPLRLALQCSRISWSSESFPKKRLETEIRNCIRDLGSRQTGDGSFRHEYPNPFTTALVLLVLKRAEQQGFEVPESLLAGALESLKRCRTEEGGFTYGQVRSGRRPRVRIPGAAGRMPLCEAALYVWGRSDRASLRKSLETAESHREVLERSRKYDDHTPPWMTGGFFFWYDLDGISLALEAIPDDASAGWKSLVHRILALPEIDGCFVDSHELGRCYGTAMALHLLHRAQAFSR